MEKKGVHLQIATRPTKADLGKMGKTLYYAVALSSSLSNAKSIHYIMIL